MSLMLPEFAVEEAVGNTGGAHSLVVTLVCRIEQAAEEPRFGAALLSASKEARMLSIPLADAAMGELDAAEQVPE